MSDLPDQSPELSRSRKILAAAEPDPVGEVFRVEGDRLVIDRSPAATDAEALNDPDLQADHPDAIAKLRTLVDKAQRADNALRGTVWQDLQDRAQKALTAIDCPLKDLPARTPLAHSASLSLGVLYDQLQRMRNAPRIGDEALAPELEVALIEALLILGPMLRILPGGRRRDGHIREFLRPGDLSASVSINLASKAQDYLKREDQALMDGLALDTGRPGPQGEKANGRFVASIRNMLLPCAVSLLLSGYANESPLVKRISHFFVKVEEEIGTIASGMAPDVGAAIRHAVDLLAKQTDAGSLPQTSPPPRFPPLEPLARWREPIPGLPEEAWPEMITLPAGKFLMGAPAKEKGSSDAEHPQSRVTVPQPFALGRTTVTFAMWDAAVAAGFKPPRGAEAPDDHGWGRGDRPVIYVNWHDAQAYCAWLNQSLGLRPGTYRLPSEAEWEYACRAGTTTPFSFGATISTDQANYNSRTYRHGKRGVYRGRTVPVGSLPRNDWGLHEMHGNVKEWVEDTFNPYRSVRTDSSPRVGDNESFRVLRGGSWDNAPLSLRAAFRYRGTTRIRDYFNGFRLARTLG
ncbi:MAG: formylglycine-generating enzyme family protein [Roseomonas sp.]|nr:formylglycine-generating enzyme family protein [Roseomonas sp.]